RRAEEQPLAGRQMQVARRGGGQGHSGAGRENRRNLEQFGALSKGALPHPSTGGSTARLDRNCRVQARQERLSAKVRHALRSIVNALQQAASRSSSSAPTGASPTTSRGP